MAVEKNGGEIYSNQMGPGSKQACDSNIWQKEARLKPIRGDKIGLFILTKGPVNEEEITVLNIHVLNSGISNYIKKNTEFTESNNDP